MATPFLYLKNQYGFDLLLFTLVNSGMQK